MASGGRADHSQQVTLSTLESPVPSPHSTQAASHLFLSHLTSTHSHTVVAPAAGWPGGWVCVCPWMTSSICSVSHDDKWCLWPACAMFWRAGLWVSWLSACVCLFSSSCATLLECDLIWYLRVLIIRHLWLSRQASS